MPKKYPIIAIDEEKQELTLFITPTRNEQVKYKSGENVALGKLYPYLPPEQKKTTTAKKLNKTVGGSSGCNNPKMDLRRYASF